MHPAVPPDASDIRSQLRLDKGRAARCTLGEMSFANLKLCELTFPKLINVSKLLFRLYYSATEGRKPCPITHAMPCSFDQRPDSQIAKMDVNVANYNAMLDKSIANYYATYVRFSGP
jgi:hypothetical protein